LGKFLASLICASLLLAACGGGGSDVSTSSGGSSGGSGSGGSGSGGGGSGGSTTNNVVNAIVDDGPAALVAANDGAVNIMYVNVTVCVPGSTTNCQTIDHVQVDTGSQGLRIISSALNSTMLSALKPVSIGAGTLAECTLFVDGYSWGPLVTADVHVGGADTATTGESAPNIPVQVIGTTTYPVPGDCESAGMNTAENTVTAFGANGIIGVGLFNYDCDVFCATTEGVNSGNGYYSCTSSGCSATLVAVASQMVNPVHALAANNGVTDNNGVIIKLPAVGATGAANVTGTLVFGIGTQSNNALAGGVSVLTTDPNGLVTTNVSSLSQNDTMSYFDSGSNAIYFEDSNIPNCTQSTGFFCPASIASLSASVTGANGLGVTVNFSIEAADQLFSANPSFTAFSNLGGSAGSMGTNTFAWGLPFYYSHNVYTAMEGVNAGGTTGPYFAF
jgi:Protein of unknown function (DUF3443)